METAAKSWSWRLAAVLMVAAIFACLAPRAAAAEMAPSPSPDSGDDDIPDVHLDEQADPRVRVRYTYMVRVRLMNLGERELELEEGELVALQKYLDQLEASDGGKGFRFDKTVWDLSPKELGFKLGVLFAQAALRCNIMNRASGEPSVPRPVTPFFVRKKLQVTGIVSTPLP